jgi:hypothetical protein
MPIAEIGSANAVFRVHSGDIRTPLRRGASPPLLPWQNARFALPPLRGRA